MSRSLAAALIASLFVVSAFAEPFIDNGIRAKEDQFPTVVKIGMYDYEYRLEFKKGVCTGTLIAPNIVLTAAHCVNADPEKRQRVSLSGDEDGDTDRNLWGLWSGGGVLVKKAYISADYAHANQRVEKIRKKINSYGSALSSSPDLSRQLYDSYEIAFDEMSKYDLAFLVLENSQTLSNGDFPKISCRDLPKGSVMTIVGYGRDYGSLQGRNSNSDHVLQFGTGTISNSVTTDDLYLFDSNTSSQMANSGDSGGPLFLGLSQKVVYGVLSGGLASAYGNNIESQYASTSSPQSRTFYRSLISMPSVPAELKSIVQSCL